MYILDEYDKATDKVTKVIEYVYKFPPKKKKKAEFRTMKESQQRQYIFFSQNIQFLGHKMKVKIKE